MAGAWKATPAKPSTRVRFSRKKVRYLNTHRIARLDPKESHTHSFFCLSPGPRVRDAVCTGNEQAAEVGDGRRQQHQQGVPGVPAHIEIVAGGEKEEISDFSGNDEVEEGDDGEKDEKVKGIE